MPVLKFILHKLIVASILIACLSFHIRGQAPVSREYQLKAAFLFNFCQFVDWPAVTFSSGEEPLVIGILGNNPFGTFLEETVAGEKVNGHPVQVHYYPTIDDLKECHILFVALSDSQKSEEVISSLEGKSVLTISDRPDFLTQKGMIKFFTSNNNIKFEINLEEAKSAKLVLSSKLLRLAQIYEPSKNN